MLDAQNPAGLLHAPLNLRLGRLAQLEAERHVVIDAHVRVEGVALEHHRDVPVLRRHVVDDAVADQNLPLGDLLQPRQKTQTGRLAAARRPDKYEELLVFDVDGEIVHRHNIAEALVDVLVGYACHLSFAPLVKMRLKLDRGCGCK